MAKPAKLSDLIEGMELQNERCFPYFDRQTGRVETVTEDDQSYLDDAMDVDDAPDWQRDSIEIARAIEDDTAGRFVALPDKFEINEWQMMDDFSRQLEQSDASDALQSAIHGRGAFRYFKDKVHELGLSEQWYAFRDARYRQIAVEWCEQNGIELTTGES